MEKVHINHLSGVPCVSMGVEPLLNAPRIASRAVVGGARYVNQQQRVIKKVSLVIARSALVENVSLSFPLSARERNSSIHADAINQRLSDF